MTKMEVLRSEVQYILFRQAPTAIPARWQEYQGSGLSLTFYFVRRERSLSCYV